jgi:hypothetical protein
LGYQPEKRPLVLTKGADFIQELTPEAGEFPAGTTAKIVVSSDTGTVLATWNATVTVNKISWQIEAEEADVIPVRSPYRLYLSFPGAPRLDYCRYYGAINRKE